MDAPLSLLLMMMDLPSSDQASKGVALIPIVGNNTERGGESVLLDQYLNFQILICIRYFNLVK